MVSDKQALILQGGWEGHQPRECAELVAGMLRDAQFQVRISDDPDVFGDSRLSDFDLIVPIVSMGEIRKEAVSNFAKAIESGTGLAGFHGGMGDSFRAQAEYQFVVGGQFVAHPGNLISYHVKIVDRTDPITAGVDDFDYFSEQYYMHVDPAIHVLATTEFTGEHCAWTKGVTMPVAWRKQYGAGKVFYSALGHVAAEFKVEPMRKLFLQGMLWASRK